MKLDRVTLTGADNNVRPEDLLALSEEFPFVEWGILVSQSREGTDRFPSSTWIRALAALARAHPMHLSLHVCGQWVRDLLVGKVKLPQELTDGLFQRIQLNFHAEKTHCDPAEFALALHQLGPRQFIFQIDGNGGNEHLENVSWAADDANHHLDAVGLFDLSGGNGIVPQKWPEPAYIEAFPDGSQSPKYHGYAGGLGPHNLAAQLPLIQNAAGDCRIWIDMESHLRSAADRLFHLGKARSVLELTQKWIRGDPPTDVR